MYAAGAQKKCTLIVARASEALPAAKRRGVKLGVTGRQCAAENKANAKAQAAALLPILRTLKKEGITSVRAITAELNRRGVPSARGGKWHLTSVVRLLSRIS